MHKNIGSDRPQRDAFGTTENESPNRVPRPFNANQNKMKPILFHPASLAKSFEVQTKKMKP
jgi:hypothetical protein